MKKHEKGNHRDNSYRKEGREGEKEEGEKSDRRNERIWKRLRLQKTRKWNSKRKGRK